MDTKFSANRKSMFVSILSIFAILSMALANTGFSVQAAQRSLPGDWDSRAVQKATVLHDENGYKMWYDGVNFFDQTQVGLATSEDGTSWAKYYDNPVLTGGSEGWDSSGEHAPFVMKDGDGYKMWYEGSDGSVRQLGYATSTDGIHWSKYEGNPVLRAGPEGYDQEVAGHGSVLFEDGLYKLWYHAIGDQGILIAYATSPDGVNWTKEGPVLLQEEGMWDAGGLWGPSVLKLGDTYWIWYSAGSPIYPTSVGVATSQNGVDWTRVGEGPVLTLADDNIGDPHVIFEGGIFKMWVNNFSDGRIYYAESADGIQWSAPNLVLSPGLLSPLEGWHDGMSGNVDARSCTAFGWAADPDDRDRDVQVRILSDGIEVASLLASDYGEDMEQNGICPGGTCRFTVNLLDKISLGEAHEITVQAYDVESADWWNLEGTPKSLTCTPHPRIVASITENWFYLAEFTPNTLIDFSIYQSQGGPLLWQGSAMTNDSGFGWVDAEGRWDLEPGNYLVISDGAYIKDLVIEAFTFDLFDATQGLLQGTAPAPFGRQIWVGIGWDNDGWSTDVTTDKKGAWAADFGAPVPNGYTWVAAQIFDSDGDASELRPALTIDRAVSIGNFYVDWSTTDPEEIVDLRWNGSANLTNSFGYSDSACPQALEYFGNSWVSENEGTPDFFFASLVGYGMTGMWKEQTNSKIKISSISSGCPASAEIPIKTNYQFFDDEGRANLLVVQRTFKFDDAPYTHDVRPFIPRLYPFDGFTEVLHPNASGDQLVTDTTCDIGCVAESWNGSWFAIHNPATGVGMIVQHKPSSYTTVLWLDNDGGSFTNASSMLLLQPMGGFTGAVTETEYLCLYDSNIWTPSLTLPAGCQP